MIHPSADVDDKARVPDSAKVWHLAQVRENAVLGEHVIVGRGAYVDSGVHVGDGSKIQNHALVYEPAIIGAGVFIGPGAVLTNDTYPRAVLPDMTPKGPQDWQPVGVTVKDGASIGARAVVVAPVTVGAWAMVAAGAVVTRDVPDHALVAGTPARQMGWVSRAGRQLIDCGNYWQCPLTGERYELTGDQMVQVNS